MPIKSKKIEFKRGEYTYFKDLWKFKRIILRLKFRISIIVLNGKELVRFHFLSRCGG